MMKMVGAARADDVPTDTVQWNQENAEGIFPRIVTAMQLLEAVGNSEAPDNDDTYDRSPFYGLPRSEEEVLAWEVRALEVWDIEAMQTKVRTCEPHPPSQLQPVLGRSGETNSVQAAPATSSSSVAAANAASLQQHQESGVDVASLILPPGDNRSFYPKCCCVFPVMLEDDQEFCLVKRILGKGGCNMRQIAEECNAKVRLRGIGSGFREGPERQEANVPLEINLSCTYYDEYAEAVGRLAKLLQDLYVHYRRYALSRHLEVPHLEIAVQELKREDIPDFKVGKMLSARAGYLRAVTSQQAEQEDGGLLPGKEGELHRRKPTAAEISELERQRRAEESRARLRWEASYFTGRGDDDDDGAFWQTAEASNLYWSSWKWREQAWDSTKTQEASWWGWNDKSDWWRRESR